MTLHDQVNIVDTVFAQMVDDEMVILDSEKGEYFGLDEMAALIWQELDASEGSLQAAFDAIYGAYEVDAEQLERDICHFVQELADAGLVQLEG